MPPEIHPADPRLRRTLAIVMTLAVIAAVAVTLGFRHWIGATADLLSTERLIALLRQLIGALMMMSAACVLILALHALRTAAGIDRERRWPLARSRTLRDVPVRREVAARRIAQAARAGALLLSVLAAAAAVLAWRLLGLPWPA
ncbi:MAG: hypothetical protein DI564_01490 [Rhodanobacter denitrificans]|uniref:Uncharacterized protein n=1 Tax=Rhodanobacter denitrificans TaxID=666685 RepID=A0A2W5N051_9GAMM|nr:MAG: hypothetical protein DI564_01490 [Rhodanobacter denitrificans]